MELEVNQVGRGSDKFVEYERDRAERNLLTW